MNRTSFARRGSQCGLRSEEKWEGEESSATLEKEGFPNCKAHQNAECVCETTRQREAENPANLEQPIHPNALDKTHCEVNYAVMSFVRPRQEHEENVNFSCTGLAAVLASVLPHLEQADRSISLQANTRSPRPSLEGLG